MILNFNTNFTFRLEISHTYNRKYIYELYNLRTVIYSEKY